MAQELKTQTPTLPVTPPGRMTYEEFLEWADGIRAEWVDGEVILMSTVSFAHQYVAEFLAASLRVFTEENNLGQVLTAPFQVRLRTRPMNAGLNRKAKRRSSFSRNSTFTASFSSSSTLNRYSWSHSPSPLPGCPSAPLSRS